ncbi:hypothetical protein AALB53_23470, partial [Lachnospiraceae bacterium 47-T17]
TLKTLTLILQENAIYFTTRSYLTLTEHLLILCDVLHVNLDYLLRDINDTPHENKMQEHLFSFDSTRNVI